MERTKKNQPLSAQAILPNQVASHLHVPSKSFFLLEFETASQWAKVLDASGARRANAGLTVHAKPKRPPKGNLKAKAG